MSKTENENGEVMFEKVFCMTCKEVTAENVTKEELLNTNWSKVNCCYYPRLYVIEIENDRKYTTPLWFVIDFVRRGWEK